MSDDIQRQTSQLIGSVQDIINRSMVDADRDSSQANGDCKPFPKDHYKAHGYLCKNLNIGSKVHIGKTYKSTYYGAPQSQGSVKSVNPVHKHEPDPPQTEKSPPDLKSDPSIQQALCDKSRVDAQQLNIVARYACQKWQMLGEFLNMTRPRLSFIYEDYHEGSHMEVPFQMLLQWSQMVCPHDTVAALSTGLVRAGLGDVAKKLVACA